MLSGKQSKKATEEKVESERQSSIAEPNIVGNEEDFENYLFDPDQEEYWKGHDAKKKKRTGGMTFLDEVNELKKNQGFTPQESADDVLDNLRNSFMTPGDNSERQSFFEPCNTSEHL